MNSRAGCPTYALSRGASSPLEYYSKCPRFLTHIKFTVNGRCCKKWRRGRDSNPWLFRVTGFQDQLLKPLGHLSVTTQENRNIDILSCSFGLVNSIVKKLNAILLLFFSICDILFQDFKQTRQRRALFGGV